MRLQIKPTQWSCLATAFAMALDIPVEEFFTLAGHNGGEIVFPKLPEPRCRRGFHISEAVYVAMQLGYTATPLEMLPEIAPSDASLHSNIGVSYTPFGPEYNQALFETFIVQGSGVIECRTPRGNWHAVAFSEGIILDPDGREFAYTREGCEQRGLYTVRLWLIQRGRA